LDVTAYLPRGRLRRHGAGKFMLSQGSVHDRVRCEDICLNPGLPDNACLWLESTKTRLPACRQYANEAERNEIEKKGYNKNYLEMPLIYTNPLISY